jgi:hypothetical protein
MGVPLAVFGAFAVAILYAVLLTWPAMLLFGAVHLDVFTWVPALSLWQTFLVVMLIRFLIPTSSGTDS